MGKIWQIGRLLLSFHFPSLPITRFPYGLYRASMYLLMLKLVAITVLYYPRHCCLSVCPILTRWHGVKATQARMWQISPGLRWFFNTFLRATAVPAGTAEARISYGNSVCLSVCPSWPGAETTEWDRDSGSSPYDSLESLASNELILVPLVRRFPSNEGIKEGYPP